MSLCSKKSSFRILWDVLLIQELHLYSGNLNSETSLKNRKACRTLVAALQQIQGMICGALDLFQSAEKLASCFVSSM